MGKRGLEDEVMDSPSEKKSGVQRLECQKIPIDRVTVYGDRADVSRRGIVTLRKGENSIHIVNLPNAVVDDTIRVSGTGSATIHEVQMTRAPATEFDKESEQARELHAEIEKAERELYMVHNKKKLLVRERDLLEFLLSKMGESTKTPSTAGELFAFHREKCLKMSEEDINLILEERKCTEVLNDLRKQYAPFESQAVAKALVVVIESDEDRDIDLSITYQVLGARWRPSYEIRVENVENERKMQVTYSGRVTQNSGEEWEDCQLVLSTARPSIGGALPELRTLDVSLNVKPMMQPTGVCLFGSASSSALAEKAFEGFGGHPPPSESTGTAIAFSNATLEEQAFSSEFLIARRADIPSDGADHKVTIGVASLTPILQYECIPSKNNSVYLTASAANISAFPFLQGEAAIYLDGNFVTKSPLKAVSPGEVFTVSLGVDSAVRIDYKPAHDIKGEAGLITTRATTVRERKTSLKNTRREPVLVTVKEQIPRSTDEKIKVTLVSPHAHPGTNEEGVKRREGALLNAANILEWTVLVGPGEMTDLVVKWQIDYPNNERLNYHEHFAGHSLFR